MEDLDLIQIHTVSDKITAEALEEFLEKYDIKVFIKPNPGSSGAFLGRFGGLPPVNPWLIYVPKDKAEEAKLLIKDFDFKIPIFSSGPSGAATTSFLLGLLWLFVWTVPLIALIIQIAGLFSGIKGLKSPKRFFAILGIIFCSVGIFLSILLIFSISDK